MENQLMETTVQVQLRSVYGTDKIYPMNPAALRFAQIANTTTLTERTLELIQRLGYKLEWLPYTR